MVSSAKTSASKMLAVEGVQAVGVAGKDGHVVDP